MSLSANVRLGAGAASGIRSALGRSARAFVGGLVLLFAFLFVASRLVASIIRLVGVTATFDAGGTAHLGLPLPVWLPALALLAVAFVFVAGLTDVLVQGSTSDPHASLRSVFGAFRRTHWLLLAGLIAVPLIVVVALSLSYLPWVVVLVLADLILVFGLYAVPLILDRRLDTLRALAESVHLTWLGSFARQYTVLAAATLATFGFWHVVWARIAALGQFDEYGLAVHVGDAASWPLGSLADGKAVFGITTGDLLVSLAESAALALTCGALAVVVAGLYLRARRSAADAPVARQFAPRPRTRSWPAIIGALTVMVAMAGAALFLSWYATPPNERPLAPGQTVALRNGITLTVPAGAHASLFPTREYPSWLGLGDRGLPSVMFFQGPFADAVAWNIGAMIVGSYSPAATLAEMNVDTRRSPLVASAPDGTVAVYWSGGGRYGFVLTHLPGHLAGFVQARLTDSWRYVPLGPAQAMQGLAEQWRVSSLQGVHLPAQTAWQSQSVAPGRRVTLSCGLSLVMPHGWSAELASTKLTTEPAQMFMPLTIHSSGWYGEVMSLRGESDRHLPLAIGGSDTQLLARSATGAVEVYGPKPSNPTQTDVSQTTTPYEEWVSIVVRLPGHAIGLLRGYVMTKGSLSRSDAWRCARRLWTTYQVEGTALPQL
jgi:hypothetical protein